MEANDRERKKEWERRLQNKSELINNEVIHILQDLRKRNNSKERSIKESKEWEEWKIRMKIELKNKRYFPSTIM